MHPIFADVEADLAEAEAEALLVTRAGERLEGLQDPASDPLDRYILVNAVASGVERSYSGIERALVRIVRAIDGHVPDDPAWHATLLRRLSRELPGRRPPLLADATYSMLDRLRAFRHRERNSYTRHLDPGLLIEQAQGVMAAVRATKEDVGRLAKHMDAPPAS